LDDEPLVEPNPAEPNPGDPNAIDIDDVALVYYDYTQQEHDEDQGAHLEQEALIDENEGAPMEQVAPIEEANQEAVF